MHSAVPGHSGLMKSMLKSSPQLDQTGLVAASLCDVGTCVPTTIVPGPRQPGKPRLLYHLSAVCAEPGYRSAPLQTEGTT